jgi:CRP-like cAMP-binding protein
MMKESKMFPNFESEPTVMANIASKMDLTVCNAGEYLYNEGDTSMQMHIVCSGEVKVAKEIDVVDEEENRYSELATLISYTKGQFFGHGKVNHIMKLKLI